MHSTGVKERHLETVLPARGGKVIVVRGAEKGATGKLLAKNKEKETALVQVRRVPCPPSGGLCCPCRALANGA